MPPFKKKFEAGNQMNYKKSDAFRTASVPKMRNAYSGQENRLADTLCAKCQIGILKIHKIPLVKSAERGKSRRSDTEKASGAKINFSG